MVLRSLRGAVHEFRRHLALKKVAGHSPPHCCIPSSHKFEIESSLDEALSNSSISGIKYRDNQNDDLVIGIAKEDVPILAVCLSEFCSKNALHLEVHHENIKRVAAGTRKIEKELNRRKWCKVLLNDLTRCKTIRFSLEVWQSRPGFYVAPRRNPFIQRYWIGMEMETAPFREAGLKDLASLTPYTSTLLNVAPIDFVFTWVNSDDPNWSQMKSKYIALNRNGTQDSIEGSPQLKPFLQNDSDAIERFRSRDELQYAVRSIFQYASFFRNMYIVSNCSPPNWLDLESDRVHWVWHEQILPQSSLPTFNSHAIETALHRIPGLSERFVYLNDDMMIARPTTPNDFFFPNGIEKIRFENYGNVAGITSPHQPDYLNGAINSSHLLEKKYARSSMSLLTHSARSMRKSTWNALEDEFGKELANTSGHRLRSIDDQNPCFLYAHFSVLNGTGVPDDEDTELVQVNHNFKKIFKSFLRRKKQGKYGELPLSICINDGGGSKDDPDWDRVTGQFLNQFFDVPSPVEKTR